MGIAMRNAKRNWHFWENRPCVNLFSSFLFKQRKILRTEKPTAPPPFSFHKTLCLKEPIQFSASLCSANELCLFWNEHFKTAEWTVEYTEKDVMGMLQTEHTIILGVRNPEGDIIGTVASLPLDGDIVCHNETLRQKFFQVGCLVIHPHMRGKGLAGWLLAWLDVITSRNEAVVHSWIRESRYTNTTKLPMRTIVPFSKMITAQVRYTDLVTRAHPEKVEILSWSVVKEMLDTIKVNKNHGFDLLYIPHESPNTTWCSVGVPDHPSCAMIIGIAKTKRMRMKKHIYNVIFTCFVRVRPEEKNGFADPFWYQENSYCPYIQDCIEAASFAQKCDIVTITNSPTCGDPFVKRWSNWSMSGRKRKLYLYNWNHASLINGNIIWPIL